MGLVRWRRRPKPPILASLVAVKAVDLRSGHKRQGKENWRVGTGKRITMHDILLHALDWVMSGHGARLAALRKIPERVNGWLAREAGCRTND